jgi:hypothetical protein
MAKQPEHK